MSAKTGSPRSRGSNESPKISASLGSSASSSPRSKTAGTSRPDVEGLLAKQPEGGPKPDDIEQVNKRLIRIYHQAKKKVNETQAVVTKTKTIMMKTIHNMSDADNDKKLQVCFKTWLLMHSGSQKLSTFLKYLGCDQAAKGDCHQIILKWHRHTVLKSADRRRKSFAHDKYAAMTRKEERLRHKYIIRTAFYRGWLQRMATKKRKTIAMARAVRYDNLQQNFHFHALWKTWQVYVGKGHVEKLHADLERHEQMRAEHVEKIENISVENKSITNNYNDKSESLRISEAKSESLQIEVTEHKSLLDSERSAKRELTVAVDLLESKLKQERAANENLISDLEQERAVLGRIKVDLQTAEAVQETLRGDIKEERKAKAEQYASSEASMKKLRKELEQALADLDKERDERRKLDYLAQEAEEKSAAAIKKLRAELEETQANLAQERVKWKRMEDKLRSEIEQALSDVSQEKVKLSRSEENLSRSEDAVMKEKAALGRAEIELEHLKKQVSHLISHNQNRAFAAAARFMSGSDNLCVKWTFAAWEEAYEEAKRERENEKNALELIQSKHQALERAILAMGGDDANTLMHVMWSAWKDFWNAELGQRSEDRVRKQHRMHVRHTAEHIFALETSASFIALMAWKAETTASAQRDELDALRRDMHLDGARKAMMAMLGNNTEMMLHGAMKGWHDAVLKSKHEAHVQEKQKEVDKTRLLHAANARRAAAALVSSNNDTLVSAAFQEWEDVVQEAAQEREALRARQEALQRDARREAEKAMVAEAFGVKSARVILKTHLHLWRDVWLWTGAERELEKIRAAHAAASEELELMRIKASQGAMNALSRLAEASGSALVNAAFEAWEEVAEQSRAARRERQEALHRRLKAYEAAQRLVANHEAAQLRFLFGVWRTCYLPFLKLHQTELSLKELRERERELQEKLHDVEIKARNQENAHRTAIDDMRLEYKSLCERSSRTAQELRDALTNLARLHTEGSDLKEQVSQLEGSLVDVRLHEVAFQARAGEELSTERMRHVESLSAIEDLYKTRASYAIEQATSMRQALLCAEYQVRPLTDRCTALQSHAAIADKARQAEESTVAELWARLEGMESEVQTERARNTSEKSRFQAMLDDSNVMHLKAVNSLQAEASRAQDLLEAKAVEVVEARLEFQEGRQNMAEAREMMMEAQEALRNSYDSRDQQSALLVVHARLGSSLLQLFRHLCMHGIGSLEECWRHMNAMHHTNRISPHGLGILFFRLGLNPDGKHRDLLEDVFALLDRDGDTVIDFEDFCHASATDHHSLAPGRVLHHDNGPPKSRGRAGPGHSSHNREVSPSGRTAKAVTAAMLAGGDLSEIQEVGRALMDVPDRPITRVEVREEPVRDKRLGQRGRH